MMIRHPDSARSNDLYETLEVATLALLRAECEAGKWTIEESGAVSPLFKAEAPA